MDNGPTPGGIAALRRRLGLSQPAFAALVNAQVPGLAVDGTAVSRWEHGRVSPSGPARAALAAVQEDHPVGRRVLAVTPIRYDRRADVIEPTERRHDARWPDVRAINTELGYEVVSTDLAGWGNANAVIYVEGAVDDAAGGYYLAELADE